MRRRSRGSPPWLGVLQEAPCFLAPTTGSGRFIRARCIFISWATFFEMRSSAMGAGVDGGSRRGKRVRLGTPCTGVLPTARLQALPVP